VYEYGADKVIKFSKFDYLLGYERAKEVVPREYALCKEFFGEYLLDREIVVSPDRKRIAVIQPKISGHFFNEDDLADAEIRKQFESIARRHVEMVARGHPDIDLIGHEGLFAGYKKRFGNVMVTNDRKLRIFDATLIDMSRFPLFLRLFLHFPAKIFCRFQRKSINRFLAQPVQ
jgi:hypothetical protein